MVLTTAEKMKMTMKMTTLRGKASDSLMATHANCFTLGTSALVSPLAVEVRCRQFQPGRA